jgi:hypothetical protein
MVQIERRKFLLAAGASVATPLAHAQERAMPVVGFLNGASYELSAYSCAPSIRA